LVASDLWLSLFWGHYLVARLIWIRDLLEKNRWTNFIINRICIACKSNFTPLITYYLDAMNHFSVILLNSNYKLKYDLKDFYKILCLWENKAKPQLISLTFELKIMSRRIRTYKKLKNSFGSVTYVTKIEWQNNKSFSFGKIESVEKKLEKNVFRLRLH